MMAHRRASLTIEAAMVLPVFIFALLTLVSLISMKQKAMDIQEEMFMEAASIAVNETAGPEYRELSVKRELFPMIRMFGPLSVNVERKCLFHVWNGYGGGYFPDDEIVYVTEGSEVYHRDRNCSHLKLTVTKTISSSGKYPPPYPFHT